MSLLCALLQFSSMCLRFETAVLNDRVSPFGFDLHTHLLFSCLLASPYSWCGPLCCLLMFLTSWLVWSAFALKFENFLPTRCLFLLTDTTRALFHPLLFLSILLYVDSDHALLRVSHWLSPSHKTYSAPRRGKTHNYVFCTSLLCSCLSMFASFFFCSCLVCVRLPSW